MPRIIKTTLGAGVLVCVLACAYYFGRSSPVAASVSIVMAALSFVALLAMIGRDEPN